MCGWECRRRRGNDNFRRIGEFTHTWTSREMWCSQECTCKSDCFWSREQDSAGHKLYAGHKRSIQEWECSRTCIFCQWDRQRNLLDRSAHTFWSCLRRSSLLGIVRCTCHSKDWRSKLWGSRFAHQLSRHKCCRVGTCRLWLERLDIKVGIFGCLALYTVQGGQYSFRRRDWVIRQPTQLRGIWAHIFECCWRRNWPQCTW
jgi:hypothetical protein